MKKIISILLGICLLASICSILCFTISAEETTATEYIFGNHSANPLSEAGMQGFTPVMTKTKTTGYDGAELTSLETIIGNLATPPKSDALEEGATRWGLSGAAWESVGQWNYTAIRSDGRISPYRVAAGVRFDVPTNGLYNISADFFNNSMATGYIHYIVLKSSDTITTLYSFDTVSVEGDLHNVTEGSRKQSIKKVLNAGDEIYFLMDSKGEKASDVWPNLKVNITCAEVLPEYVFGNHTVNPLSEAGMQGFTPVMTTKWTTGGSSGTVMSADEIVSLLATAPKKDALEENATRWGLWGQNWQNVGEWNYTSIRSDGRVIPSRTAAGVRFDVPITGLYNISADFFNGSMPLGFVHYIILKSGDTVTTLYRFDTVEVSGTNHEIAKGTRKQEISKALKTGDELYFLMDAKGEKAENIWPNLEVTIAEMACEHTNTEETNVVPATYFTEGSKDIVCSDCGETVSTNKLPCNTTDPVSFETVLNPKTNKLTVTWKYSTALATDIATADACSLKINYSIGGKSNTVEPKQIGDVGGKAIIDGINAIRFNETLKFGIVLTVDSYDALTLNAADVVINTVIDQSSEKYTEYNALLNVIKDASDAVIAGEAEGNKYLNAGAFKVDIKNATAEIKFNITSKYIDIIKANGSTGRSVALVVTIGNDAHNVKLDKLMSSITVNISGLSFEQMYGNISAKLVIEYANNTEKNITTDEVTFSFTKAINNSDNAVAEAFEAYNK